MSDLDAYDFELPRDLIAQVPLRHRADARLLVVNRAQGTIDTAHVRDLPDYLEGDLLVLNDTRVVRARLAGRREQTGGRWTGLFLGTGNDGEGAAEDGLWKVLCKSRGRLRPLERVILEDRDSRPCWALQLLAPLGEGVWAAKPERPGTPEELLEQVGRVPLPPYIRGGEMMDADIASYQTIFASKPGAVAAPTAGLHFTEPLLRELNRRRVDVGRVTLHVGLGTFRPIKAERLDDHVMHEEWAELSESTAAQLRACRERQGRIVAVGTTVVRTLESAAQRAGFGQPWSGVTDLFIRPPYTFQSVDALLTNFHLPRSTLLILVRTFGGDDLIREAYATAIREEFRFYSYGDAMLIL